MPRSARNSDDETETRAGRKTRTTTEPCTIDSPLRRSTRIRQPTNKQNETPPDSPVNDGGNVQVSRTTRRRTGSMDFQAQPRWKLLKNFVSADITEQNADDSHLADTSIKRNTRRSLADISALDVSKSNTRSKRNTRAGSEAKTSPPIRVTRKTRASSVGLEPIQDFKRKEKVQLERVDTPERTRRRASIAPSRSPVAEETEQKRSIPYVKLENILPKVEETCHSGSSREALDTAKLQQRGQTADSELNHETGQSGRNSIKEDETSIEGSLNDTPASPASVADNSAGDLTNDTRPSQLSKRAVENDNEESNPSMLEVESTPHDTSTKLARDMSEEDPKITALKSEIVLDRSIKEQDKSTGNKENQCINIITETSFQQNEEFIAAANATLNSKPFSSSFICKKETNETDNASAGAVSLSVSSHLSSASKEAEEGTRRSLTVIKEIDKSVLNKKNDTLDIYNETDAVHLNDSKAIQDTAKQSNQHSVPDEIDQLHNPSSTIQENKTISLPNNSESLEESTKEAPVDVATELVEITNNTKDDVDNTTSDIEMHETNDTKVEHSIPMSEVHNDSLAPVFKESATKIETKVGTDKQSSNYCKEKDERKQERQSPNVSGNEEIESAKHSVALNLSQSDGEIATGTERTESDSITPKMSDSNTSVFRSSATKIETKLGTDKPSSSYCKEKNEKEQERQSPNVSDNEEMESGKHSIALNLSQSDGETGTDTELTESDSITLKMSDSNTSVIRESATTIETKAETDKQVSNYCDEKDEKKQERQSPNVSDNEEIESAKDSIVLNLSQSDGEITTDTELIESDSITLEMLDSNTSAFRESATKIETKVGTDKQSSKYCKEKDEMKQECQSPNISGDEEIESAKGSIVLNLSQSDGEITTGAELTESDSITLKMSDSNTPEICIPTSTNKDSSLIEVGKEKSMDCLDKSVTATMTTNIMTSAIKSKPMDFIGVADKNVSVTMSTAENKTCSAVKMDQSAAIIESSDEASVNISKTEECNKENNSVTREEHSLGKKRKSSLKKEENLSDVENEDFDTSIGNLFQDIPANEWETKVGKKKHTELESSSVHSMSTERLENESEVECEFTLVDKEAGLAAENLKARREIDTSPNYDSNDTVALKSQSDSLIAQEEVSNFATIDENRGLPAPSSVLSVESRIAIEDVESSSKKINVLQSGVTKSKVCDMSKSKKCLKAMSSEELHDTSHLSEAPQLEREVIKSHTTKDSSTEKTKNDCDSLNVTPENERKSMESKCGEVANNTPTVCSSDDDVSDDAGDDANGSAHDRYHKEGTPKKSGKDGITKNDSMMAHVDSNSEDKGGHNIDTDSSDDKSGIAKIPKFLYAETTTGDGDARDSDAYSSNSINSDIAREYNLHGNDILNYSDDDVPGDECRASETESSDSQDNGSDLADFVVDDDESEEEAAKESHEKEKGDEGGKAEKKQKKQKKQKKVKKLKKLKKKKVDETEIGNDDDDGQEENEEERDLDNDQSDDEGNIDNIAEEEDIQVKANMSKIDLRNNIDTKSAANKELSSTPKQKVQIFKGSARCIPDNDEENDDTENENLKSAANVNISMDGSSCKGKKKKKNVSHRSTERVDKNSFEQLNESDTIFSRKLKKVNSPIECSTPKANVLKHQGTAEILSTSAIIAKNESRKCRANIASDNVSFSKGSVTENIEKSNTSAKNQCFNLHTNLSTDSPELAHKKEHMKRKQPLTRIDDVNKTTIAPGDTSATKFLKRQRLHESAPTLILNEVNSKIDVTRSEKECLMSLHSQESSIALDDVGAVDLDGRPNESLSFVAKGKHSKKQSTSRRAASKDTRGNDKRKCEETRNTVKPTENSFYKIDDPNEEMKKEEAKKKRKLIEKQKTQLFVRSEACVGTVKTVKEKKQKRNATKEISEQLTKSGDDVTTVVDKEGRKRRSKNTAVATKRNSRKVSAVGGDVALSDSDKVSVSSAFSKARDKTLESIKKVTENITTRKVRKERKHNEQRRRAMPNRQRNEESILALDATKKVLKRLAEADLEKLSDVPLRPRKKGKLDQIKTDNQEQELQHPRAFRSRIASGMIEAYSSKVVLSSHGSMTKFSVESLEEVKKHPKKHCPAALFRQAMLSRNTRHPISAYLMYIQKQKASRKEN